MAPKPLYQGQGELDFSKEQESDMSELLGFPPPSGEERALSTDSATSNVEVYSQSPTEVQMPYASTPKAKLTPQQRRRTQLREAQRKHRQRRQDQMEDLQTQVHRLTDQLRQAERDKAMLYNILQRVLAQLESQRQAFTSDLPQLVERSVAAHLGTSPSPTIGAVPTSGVSSGGTTEFWSPGVGGPTQYQYGQPGHSPVIGYNLPQRFSLPTCESPIMAPHPSSVSPYERPTFSWATGPEREPGLWLNEEEARFLNSFSGVSSA